MEQDNMVDGSNAYCGWLSSSPGGILIDDGYFPQQFLESVIDVYQITNGCAIDVQEIEKTDYRVPKLDGDKWVRVMSQRTNLFTSEDIFSDYNEEHIIFAYPPVSVIDLKNNTITRVNGHNIVRDVKWVVKISRVLLSNVNYIFTEV